MSGHSKWHNIQKTKGAADAKRAQAFTKIAREMIVAVKEGGSGDPNNNSRLAAVITKAKAANMEKIAILENKIEETERRTLIEKATENNREQKETANEVRKFAKQNPDLTASIIRTMIKGDDNK